MIHIDIFDTSDTEDEIVNDSNHGPNALNQPLSSPQNQFFNSDVAEIAAERLRVDALLQEVEDVIATFQAEQNNSDFNPVPTLTRSAKNFYQKI